MENRDLDNVVHDHFPLLKQAQAKTCIVEKCKNKKKFEQIELTPSELLILGLPIYQKATVCRKHFAKAKHLNPATRKLNLKFMTDLLVPFEVLRGHFFLPENPRVCDKNDVNINNDNDIEQVPIENVSVDVIEECVEHDLNWELQYNLDLYKIKCDKECDENLKRQDNFLNNVYLDLGSGRNIEEIYKLFEIFTGFERSDIKVIELIFYHDFSQDECNPKQDIYEPDKKLTIFIKKNPNNCSVHSFIVVSILVLNGISLEQEEKFKDNLWNEKDVDKSILKLMDPSENSGRKSWYVKRVKDCDCNENFHAFTRTFGCTKHIKDNKCKFVQTPKNFNTGRRRFKLQYDTRQIANDACLETFCHNVADVLSDGLKTFVPLANENLRGYLENATNCQLGRNNNKVFSALSLVGYIAHHHRDNFNYPLGATAILTLTNQVTCDQTHFLPQFSVKGRDRELGCFSINLPSRSFLFEKAYMEVHATYSQTMADKRVSNWQVSDLKKNKKFHEINRIGLVAFTHKYLNLPNHGADAPKSDEPPKRKSKPSASKSRKRQKCVKK